MTEKHWLFISVREWYNQNSTKTCGIGVDIDMAKEQQNAVIRRKSRTTRTKTRKRADYYDYNLLAAVILLICFGLIMLYSASYYEAFQKISGNDDMYYFRRQALICMGGVVGAIVLSKINYHIYTKFASAIYVLSLILMAMVRFSPLGVDANGSKRWLNLGIQFQPSEMAKIAVILFLPMVIIKMGKQVKTLKAFCILMVIGGMQAVGAKVFTDNLSTALIILGIACALIYLAHPKTAPFVAAAVLAIVLSVAGVSIIAANMDATSGFRIRRVLTWLNPEGYLEDGGFQVIQGLYAIGSGGFFGKGLGNSEQKLSTIPEAQNDMIFSIVCEETGILGAFLTLFLFGILIWRLCILALNCRDLQGTLLCAEIMAHMAIQVVLNVAVVTNTIPNTGITLPFVSYGGTSVVFLLGEMGLTLSVSSHRHGRIT